jgi:hypothetical protein
MNRASVLLLLSAALLVPGLHAQEPQAKPGSAPSACPSTATLDQLISAIDAAVSGPANQDRTCFRALFLPDARLIPIRVGADGTATPHVLTVDGWIDAVAKNGTMVFYEKQIKVSTESWAHMAHLWSTYETRTTPDGKPPEGKVLDRGINSIQAIFDGKQWHITQIIWQAEKPDDPVPAKYLP